VTDRAVARRTDPDTSWAAAHSVTELREKQRLVYEILEHYGPLTDQGIAGYYGHDPSLPIQSPSGLRTRRCELVDKGLVKDTGERVKLRTGRRAAVWRVTTEEERRPPGRLF
jgi:hypothetical protein